MLEFGYITESELRQWTEQWCDALAWELYPSATQQYADDVFYPERLAWWLYRKLFSKSELKLIRFDHGEGGGNYAGENYVKTYLPKDFIESIMEKLRDPISWEQENERIRRHVQKTQMSVRDWCDDRHCCC